MSDNPPVALFVHRRPDHARATLEALSSCPEAAESDLVVFSDGPRDPGQAALVEQTRDVVKAARGFRSVRVVERTLNVGLFQNVVAGLTEMFSANPSVIVLEDDIVVSRGFLTFMHAALAEYERNADVCSVTGYLYPADFRFPDQLDSFLFPRFCCWGWATWQDRWSQVDWSIPDRNRFMKSVGTFRRFWDASNDLPEIMLDLIDGKNSSWSILFNYWQVLQGGYSAYPTRSHASNIGFDGTGTHAGNKEKFRIQEEEPSTHDMGGEDFLFAKSYDKNLAGPLRRYFLNRPRRRVKNLLKYGRLF
jgi:hypothetical protein